MKTNKFLYLLAAFVVGFALGTIGKVTYESSVFKPWVWKELPIIVNCYGKDFSEPQLVRAIDYWTLRGEGIGFYEMRPSKQICENKHLDGFIILRKAKRGFLNKNTLASTTRRTSLGNMRSAVIYFSPGSQNLDLLIEHELGHALGFGHIEEEGHVMHPTYSKMGPAFYFP